MYQPINVTYEAVTSLYRANQILQSLDVPLIACDFETAITLTDSERAELVALLDTDLPRLERIRIQARLDATALDHPSYSTITHFQLAHSEDFAYVFIINSPQMLRRIVTWLVTTPIKQVWHNATYDFSRIYYYTQRFPQNYEDTAILAKCILNHVNTNLATVGLKELAGARYGSWAVAPDSFDLSQQYDEKLLLYSATDACATYWLWNSIQRHLESICPPSPSIE